MTINTLRFNIRDEKVPPHGLFMHKWEDKDSSHNNPVWNYHHVYIPNCAGDFFWGNSLKQYDAGLIVAHRVRSKAGFSLLSFPSTLLFQLSVSLFLSLLPCFLRYLL